jgi:hypothetical protein
LALTLAGAAALPIAGSGLALGASTSRQPLAWWRSVVVHHDRVVRVAVQTRSGDELARVAEVRKTPRTVRIALWRLRPHGRTPAMAHLQCVQLHLRFRVGSRYRVDSNFGRAPDRAHRGTSVARRRATTRSLDLRHSHCTQLHAKHLRPWTRDTQSAR